MSQLDILIPFALPPASLAGDILRTLKTPALATLIGRAQTPQVQAADPFARALPHETWLKQQFGLSGADSLPLAHAAMQALGQPPADGYWFVVQPVHIHIARNHLVLTDQRQLPITEQESQDLFATVQTLFDEVGKTLRYGDAHTWFMRADDWSDLHTSTPDAACGHNIDIWLPQGSGERDWRKLQNEVQMHWHEHRVNQQRELQRAKPINSLWLWGGAGAASTLPSAAAASDAKVYLDVFSPSGYVPGMAAHRARSQPITNAARLLAAPPQHGLLLLDTLIEAALAEDWSEWIARMQQMETEWFAPLLAALQNGNLSNTTLLLTHNAQLSAFTLSRNSLRKFWAKPSLTRLQS